MTRAFALCMTLVAAVALLASCAALDNTRSDRDRDENRPTNPDAPDAPAFTRSDIVGVEWTAIWMWNAPIVKDAPPTLLLGSDNRATGFAGVNRYTGGYKLNPQTGRLRFDPLAMTRMGGPPERNAQEIAFSDRLTRTTAARINRNGELELLEKGDVILRFERAADSVRFELIGTDWSLFRLRGEAPIKGHSASIEFHDDGTITGFAGVNTFTGRYAYDDRTGRLQLTDIAADDKQGDARIKKQEDRLLASLRAVDHFEFTKEGDLLLRNADNVAARFRRNKH